MVLVYCLPSRLSSHVSPAGMCLSSAGGFFESITEPSLARKADNSAAFSRSRCNPRSSVESHLIFNFRGG
jgi:hypothetical protein